MQTFQWQPNSPVDAIVFDCDGTLSQIEGIDYLAELNGVKDEVSELTRQAMSETGVSQDLYERRMTLVKPNRHQLIELGQQYFVHRSPDVVMLIEIFISLQKELYILSAGLNPSVKIFGDLLNIPEKNIFAVDVKFDEEGNYLGYDRSSPLTRKNGKREIIQKLKLKHPRISHVGDGLNDYEAHDVVDRFIGYGGAEYRDRLSQLSEFYIKSASVLPMLPLNLTQQEMKGLSSPFQQQYLEGLNYINDGHVAIQQVKHE